MRRGLLILIGVIVLAAAGYSGLWFLNQGTARAQIEAALDQMRLAGFEADYDELAIVGFPTAYDGQFTDLTLTMQGEGVAVNFPAASAGVSLEALDRVRFGLPDEFTVTRLDAAGAPTSERMVVSSTGLQADLGPGDADDFDLNLTAQTLRVAPTAGGQDFLELADLKSSGKLIVDRESQQISLELAFAASQMTGSAPSIDTTAARLGAGAAAGAPQISMLATGVSGGVTGGLDRFQTSFRTQSVAFEEDGGGAASLKGVAFNVLVTPETRFDVAPIFAAPTGDAFTANAALYRLGAVAFAALAERGAVDLDFTIDDLDVKVITEGVAPPAPDAATGGSSAELGQGAGPSEVTFALKGFRTTTDVDPSRLSFVVGASQMLLDAETEVGGDKTEVDLEGLEVKLDGRPGDAFDFSPLLNAATGRDSLAILVDLLRREIALGGALEFTIASDRYDSFARGSTDDFGLAALRNATGANRTTISITSDQASFLLSGDDTAYELVGPDDASTGAFDIDRFELSGAHPLKKADAAQPSRLFLNLAGLDIDERLWSVLALGEAGPEPIPGLRVEAEVETALAGDLMSMPPILAFTAVRYERLLIKEALLDGLGLKAEATGSIDLVPAPSGGVLVSLSNWPGFFDRIMASQIGAAPQIAASLALADGVIGVFGAPGDAPDTTILDVQLGETGITINGQPFDG